MNEQAIFLAALDIADLAERAAYVNRTCAGEPTLLRQVEALLAAHERSGEFLDVPALQQIAVGASSPSDHSAVPGAETSAEHQAANGDIDLSYLQPSTQPGSLGRLGHYEVQEVIGRGGCGIVLKAFDDILHRMVAIKVMAPELAATSPARKRFLREARAAAAIRHENVVSIHAVEEKPIPFLVMEYIASQTLQQKLDQNGPLDIQEVVQIGNQIANGLEAAHAIGLIHRDIKPGNILLEKGRDRIKITDFGLARATDDASITQSGVIAGTPLYMSPEQAQGAIIDQRSDLFSLGSVLYVMCSGRPPFRAATTLAVLKRVAEDEPRPIQEIIPEVPDWLVAIIAKLHAKAPTDRFASAQEVANLLARCLSEMQHRGRVESLGNVLPMIPKPANAVREPVESERPRTEDRPVPAPDKRPPLPRSRRWVTAAAVLLTLFGGLSLTEATGVTNVRGTVIRLFSPDGTLVVEVDDPGVSVSIDGEEMVITGTGAREIRLKPGQYKVLASKDGKLVRQELVTVTRNGRQVVRVSKEVEPVMATGDRPKITDPDRRAAEWVLSIGGGISIKENGQVRQPGAVGDLPKGPFELTVVNLRNNSKGSDAGLAHFKDCKNLTSLDLAATKVSDAGLVHFKDCKNLTSLDLGFTKVSDAGLAHFKDCKNLTQLDLHNTLVSDAGLAVFKDCKNLTDLLVAGTQVSDAGLAHFKDCKNLTYLYLAGTQVGDAGLAHFKDCKNVTKLVLHHTKVSDAGLAHFKDCKNLTYLDVHATQVGDAGLAHLKDCKNLTNLILAGTQVSDAGLAHLKDCKNLTNLNLVDTQVSDAGLERLPALAKLGSVNVIRTKATAAGVKKLSAALPLCKVEWDGGVIEPKQATADQLWEKQIAKLPPADQLKAVAEKLKERNPGFDGKFKHVGQQFGEVVILHLSAEKITDLSPIRGLQKLQELVCSEYDKPSKLKDLSPLEGMAITRLNLSFTAVDDLSKLRGLPLTELHLWGAKVSDLSPLRGMKLKRLNLSSCPVASLDALQGMPLEELVLSRTRVSDLTPVKDCSLKTLSVDYCNITDLTLLQKMPLEILCFSYTPVTDIGPLKGLKLKSLNFENGKVRDLSPLGGMPLTFLWCRGNPLTDHTPLRGMPLEILQLNFEPERDAEVLRSIPSLKNINLKPAKEFWSEVEKKR